MPRPIENRERDSMICSLYITGETVAEIARAYSVSESRVMQILTTGGVYRPTRATSARSSAETFTYDDLVASLGEAAAKRVVTARNLRQIKVTFPSISDLGAVVAILRGERIDTSRAFMTALGQTALAYYLSHDNERIAFANSIDELAHKRLKEMQ